MAKRKNKKAPKKSKFGALKIYFGIFAFLAFIGSISYISMHFFSDIEEEKTIDKIEGYLAGQKHKLEASDSMLENTAKSNLNSQYKLNENKLNSNSNSQKTASKNGANSNSQSKNKNANSQDKFSKNNPNSQNQTNKNKTNLNSQINDLNSQKAFQAYKANITNKFNQTDKTNKADKANKANLTSNKAKLVLIIDDVSTKKQVNDIKSLGLKITPSIFPPTKNYPKSATLADEFEFYMVHLPLEAVSFHSEEENTLHVGDSHQKINSRIFTIKNQFKNLKYINNHTGSKFTSDYKSMKILLSSLNGHKIAFLDSLTSSRSKGKKLANQMGLKYLKRDVFIDNVQNVKATIKQIDQAVKIAKKRGYAIAIGHPYKTTIQAIKTAKNATLKDVDIVYLKDIYGLYN